MSDVKITELGDGSLAVESGRAFPGRIVPAEVAALREHFAAEQPATPTPSEVIDWIEADLVRSGVRTDIPAYMNRAREHFASAVATPSIEQIKAEARREVIEYLTVTYNDIDVAYGVIDRLNELFASPVPEQPTHIETGVVSPEGIHEVVPNPDAEQPTPLDPEPKTGDSEVTP